MQRSGLERSCTAGWARPACSTEETATSIRSGRFTQEDPTGIATGLNVYGFAEGDPVNFSDPFGLCPLSMGGDGQAKTLADCPDGTAGRRRYISGAVESADPLSWLSMVGGLKAGVATAGGLLLVTRKAINLPAWKAIAIDMKHIASGHMVGGTRVSALRTVFPEAMSIGQVERTVRQAYRSAEKISSQGDRVLMRGSAAGMTIEMWVNKVERLIETAHPIWR